MDNLEALNGDWKNYQDNHVFIRALERYKREITDEDIADMVAQILDNRAYVIKKITYTKTAWLVHWKSASMIVPVVFNRKYKRICTLLPKNKGKERRDYMEKDVENIVSLAKVIIEEEAIDNLQNKTVSEIEHGPLIMG